METRYKITLEALSLIYKQQHDSIGLTYDGDTRQPVFRWENKPSNLSLPQVAKIIQKSVDLLLNEQKNIYIYHNPDNQLIAIEDNTDFDEYTKSLYEKQDNLPLYIGWD